MSKEMVKTNTKENRIMNFSRNGIHFHFGDIGISMIWGWGSYSNNYDNVQYIGNDGEEEVTRFGECEDVFEIKGVYCQNVEIYPLGKWSEELKKKVLKRYNYDDFPVGYVPVEDIPYLLNLLKRSVN